MRSSLSYAPWQAGPFTTSARVAAVALVGLAADSSLLWDLAPQPTVALAIALVPALLAIRVIRALPGSVEGAAIAFAVTSLVSVVLLTAAERYTGQIVAALTVAAVLSSAGLAATAIRWARSRRPQPAVIALTRSAEHSVAVIRER
jgi:hypothetical protein